ncbi:MAG: glycosyltransferase [Gammaproteobacteria bacterium]
MSKAPLCGFSYNMVMPTVVVYRSFLLPRSETFIKAQVNSYQRWRAILLGRRLSHELSLEGLDVRTLEGENPSKLMRALLRLRLAFGNSPDVSSLARESVDLLHAHFGLDGIEAAPIARALGIPLIITLHGYDINIHAQWWHQGKGGWLMRRYPERLIRLAQGDDVHFVAVSDAIKQRAIAFGIPEQKLTVKYIGVDRSKFRPGNVPVSKRARRVLFVGRLVEKKGCEYLIRAMQIVGRAVPGAELTIVGEGPLRAALEALVAALDVKATFKGFRSSVEVRQELDAARVFCLPSITAENGDAEGLGIVLLEAQSSGVPVITSRFTGRHEGVAHGQTGFAFPERDVDELAAKLTQVLLDDVLADSMSTAGPVFVAQKFDIECCTRDLELLYDSVHESFSGSRRAG